MHSSGNNFPVSVKKAGHVPAFLSSEHERKLPYTGKVVSPVWRVTPKDGVSLNMVANIVILSLKVVNPHKFTFVGANSSSGCFCVIK